MPDLNLLAGDPALSTTVTDLKKAAIFWQNSNLKLVQRQLDTNGITILQNQKRTEEAKAELDALTPTGASDTTAVSTAFNLHKEEIERLRKRLEYAENAFLSLYPVLYEAPDPSPLLESSALVIQSALEKNQQAVVAKSDLVDSETLLNMKSQLEEKHRREEELKMQLERANQQIRFLSERSNITSSNSDPFRHGSSGDLAQLKLELEQWKERYYLADQQNEIEKYRAEVAKTTADRSALIAENEQLQRQSRDLGEQVIRANQELQLEKEHRQKDVQLLERLQLRIGQLETDLEACRKELKCFKIVEAGGYEEAQLPLDALTLSRNRKLQSELTLARNELNETKNQSIRVRQKLEEQQQRCLDLVQRNEKLEQEMEALHSPNGNSPLTLDQSTRPFLAQRDRLLQELQSSKMAEVMVKQRLDKNEHELKRLQEDNVKLFERVKYLQSCKSSTAIEMSSALNRYQPLYEKWIDPFKRFHDEESSRQLKSLSTTDRASLGVARLIVSNKYTRLASLLYLCVLHLLVFFILYKFAFAEAMCKHDHGVQFWKDQLTHVKMGSNELKAELGMVKELLEKSGAS